MRRTAICIGLTLLAGGGAGAVLAQNSTVPEELQSMVGDWSLAQADDSLPTCPITLTDQPAKGGWAIAFQAACLPPYPAADQLAAWNVDADDGSVELLNGAGGVTLRLYEDEDGLFDTDESVSPQLFLIAPYDEDGSGGEADSD